MNRRRNSLEWPIATDPQERPSILVQLLFDEKDSELHRNRFVCIRIRNVLVRNNVNKRVYLNICPLLLVSDCISKLAFDQLFHFCKVTTWILYVSVFLRAGFVLFTYWAHILVLKGFLLLNVEINELVKNDNYYWIFKRNEKHLSIIIARSTIRQNELGF